MRKLKLVGLNADGRQVVFVDDAGAEFAAPADDRLRAALRGDRARLGQLEIEMDSVLRPRDIQSRIRAGDSPETVAALAQVTVEKIMPYCIPVLAEREHIAELARRSHVRRKGGETPSRGLADVIAERLRGRGIDPRSAEWDAWRRDDGRWAIQTSYLSGERQRSALFIFDAVGRYSLPDDDEAKWLTGEQQATSKGPQPREAGKAGERRLSAVPTGGDLLSLSEDDDESDELTAVARAVQESPAHVEEALVAQPADVAETSDDVEEALVADPAVATDVPDEATSDPSTRDGQVEPERRRRTKRASVPSWDEIMFGKDDA